MDEKIILLRDLSDLSSEVEKYLIDSDIDYVSYYSNDDDMPEILKGFSCYRGESGFRIFKTIWEHTIK